MPLYRSPVEAARALGRVARYARWRERRPTSAPELGGADPDAAAAVIAAALTRGEGWLLAEEADALLAAYGIPPAERARRPGSGVEMVAGVLADPDFGPVVVCGLGRPDRRAARRRRRAARAAEPRRRGRARALAALVPAAARATAARRRADVGALEDLLVRISALADAHPEVVELDCDPVLVSGARAAAVGARVRVRPARPARPFPALDR